METLIESRTNNMNTVNCRNCRYCIPIYKNGTSTTTFIKYNCTYHRCYISIQNIDNFSCNCYE